MKYTNPKPVFNPNPLGAFCELDLAKGEAYMAAYSSRQLETPGVVAKGSAGFGLGHRSEPGRRRSASGPRRPPHG